MNRLTNCIKLDLFLLLAAVALSATGCQSNKLAEPGAYKGDEILYQADKTIVSSYRILHSFVKWEYDNRAVLPPEVSRVADVVRENASKWTDSAIALREAYAISPSSENRSALMKSLDVLETALAEATKYMAGHQPPQRPGINPP